MTTTQGISVDCPICGAVAGSPCFRLNADPRAKVTPHAARVERAGVRAERCPGSGTRQSVSAPARWERDDTDRKPCTFCGQMVRFRVRVTDLPPWARILPHRTDGTPAR